MQYGMTYLLKIFVPLTLTALLFGCQTTQATLWERHPPADIVLEKIDLEFGLVIHERLTEATERLAEQSVIELTDYEYVHFVGIPKSSSKKALLIRTIVKAFNPSGYSFYRGLKGDLYIQHGVLSRYDTSKSWPIVIFLDDVPTSVWTDCNSAG